MIKKRLFTPGPTDVPPDVLNEMAKPMFHHRTPQFREVFRAATDGLKTIFHTEQEVITICGSGTAGMEAAIACATPRDKKVLVANGGKFGERWAKIARVYDLDVDEVELEWGTAITADDVKAKVDTGEYGAVIVVQSETSTATWTDVEAIAKVTRDTDVLLMVDAITGVGALPMDMDAWGVDVVASGSQKALMTPPGLAMVSLSDKAWASVDTIDAPCFYLDLKSYRTSLAKDDTPTTGPVNLITGLRVAVDMINAIGVETIWKRTALYAKALRTAAEAIGLTLMSKSPSDSVTALGCPEGVDVDGQFRKILKTTYGASIAGGQNEWKGKVVRVNHMGYTDPLDLVGLVAAMEFALSDCGAEVAIGKGVAAVAKVLKDWQ
ncbi:MAG: aminotransferase class V-fold PLP-dependent enzyme [Planctomycetes bacterium]|jgi:aspartate aminotransferase-like enzyme|nr:aminotransferase class V-fold PLP-dependent enzyme [Planctomycetota bacterium]